MYESKICSDKKIWNDFVRSSGANNIFSETSILDILEKTNSTFIIYKKQRPIMGVIIFNQKNVDNPVHYSQNLFQGLIVNKRNKSIHSSTNEYTNACQYLLREIFKKSILSNGNILFCYDAYFFGIFFK